MPSKLVSTGVQFPDGTTQTTAASAGMTATGDSTTVYHTKPSSSYTYQNITSRVTVGEKTTFPRIDSYQSKQNSRYAPRPFTVDTTTGEQGLIPNNSTVSIYGYNTIPYPPTNYSSNVTVNSKGYPYDYGGYKSNVAWRVSYHHLS